GGVFRLGSEMTAFHPRFIRLRVSRADGGSASPLHPGGRNCTCTAFKLSKLCIPPFFGLVPIPGLSSPFLGNGSQFLPDAVLVALPKFHSVGDLIGGCGHGAILSSSSVGQSSRCVRCGRP